MIKVGIVGYGTIGRRVADAVAIQDDMELVGVVKRSPDYKALELVKRGYKLYVPSEEYMKSFEEIGLKVKGLITDLIGEVDVIVDATPGGVGARNKKMYVESGVKAIFEGGEKAEVADVSFVAQCNYEEALGKRFIRVVSCNTTGLSRVLKALDDEFRVKRCLAVIIRRAADPDDIKRGPIDSIVPNPVRLPSHHADDVKTVLKSIDIVTAAYKVPATHMHVHFLEVVLEREAGREEVIRVLEETRRVIMVEEALGVKSTSQIMDMARDMGRPRNDIYENCIWRESISVSGRKVYFSQAIHQEAIVIPENIDAIRACMAVEKEKSMRETDLKLGILRRGIK